jgi:hypothetical protein
MTMNPPSETIKHPTELHVARAFGPVAFWASTIAFAVAIAYSIYEISHKDGGIPEPKLTTSLLFGFFWLYMVRIYHGVLFYAFDESTSNAVAQLGPRERIGYFLLQTAEMTLCLCAPIALSWKGLQGGFFIGCTVTILLAIFWFMFRKIMLGKHVDSRAKLANWVTLMLDVIGAIPFAIQLLRWTEVLPSGPGDPLHLIVIILLFLGAFAIEFFMTYRGLWVKFLEHTRMALNGT